MRRWATGCGVVLLALALVAPARGAAPATVESGALRATVTPDPWHLELREGRTLLSEAAGPGSGPTGPLGFEAGGTWFHATRVVSERRAATEYVATLATNDPLGRRIELRLKPEADGVIALEASVDGARLDHGHRLRRAARASATSASASAATRSTSAATRSRTTSPTAPIRTSEQPFDRRAVPPAGRAPARRRRPTSRSRGCSPRAATACSSTTTRPASSASAATAAGAWSVEAQAPALRMRVFAGPRPAEVLRRFSARVGRQPRAGGAVLLRAVVPARPADDEANLAYADARPARRPRSPRPTRTTCRAATSRATTESERVASRASTTPAWPSRPTSTR